jgi:hypothetical protein
MGCVVSMETKKEFTNLNDGVTIKETTNYSISLTTPLNNKADAYEIISESI